MTNAKNEILEKMIVDAESIDTSTAAKHYLSRVLGYISSAFPQVVLEKYQTFISNTRGEYENVAAAVGFLEGLYQLIYSGSSNTMNLDDKEISQQKIMNLKNVFIVHGRDNEAKEIIARFIQNLGLNPIILHEQPSSGKTIIEKFERFSDVSYSVVILTPDDVGALKDGQPQKRARQNVILELGYFMGKLGRRNVCALIKDNVELPSDYHGILYIDFDSNGAWRTKLAQEFVQAKLEIKLEGLLS